MYFTNGETLRVSDFFYKESKKTLFCYFSFFSERGSGGGEVGGGGGGGWRGEGGLEYESFFFLQRIQI